MALGEGRWAVSGPCANNTGGAVWVMDGVPASSDLEAAATSRLFANGNQHHAIGWTLAAGDVIDQDGVQDLVVGNYGAVVEYTGGAAFVVGADALSSGGNIVNAAERAWTTDRGPWNLHTGTQVETIGDIDGDGADDVLVAFGGDVHLAGKENGAVFVMTDASTDGDMDAQAYAELTLGQSHRFGGALTVIDVDRDGIDDVVASAPDLGEGKTGATFVVSGQDLRGGGLIDVAPLVLATIDKTYDDKFSVSVGIGLQGGDVDGDGWDDLLVGLERSETAAAVLLLGGPTL